MEEYDIIIIGAGMAGLTSAIYSARSGNKTLVLEKGAGGGQIFNSSLVENYPGVKSTSGPDLSAVLLAQAKAFGAHVVEGAEVSEADLQKRVVVAGKTSYLAKMALIIATGCRWRKLDIPGETEFVGRGVSYCATCDGPFFRDKEVAVIGGGESAVEEAIYLTKFAKKVYLVHRRDSLRAQKYMQDEAFGNRKIEFVWNSQPVRIEGSQKVESMALKNLKSGEEKSLGVSGVFIYIGMIPNTSLFSGKLEMDNAGYIITNEKMETSVAGIYAAGDVRHSPVKQLTTAASDGTVAAVSSGCKSGSSLAPASSLKKPDKG